jgi:predicted nucleic acid-binding protein
MKYIISDTCILIDLITIDLIKEFLSLNFEIYTTDFVLEEISNPTQRCIIDQFIELKKINIITSKTDELLDIITIFRENPGLSFTDCSVFFYGKKRRLIVLTNDSKLRKLAEPIGVHGILWILEELIQHEIISKHQATIKLKKLMKINQRLPLEECRKRLRQWS